MAGIDANTEMMLHMNGADTSIVVNDSSPAAHGNMTMTGTAQIDTARDKWGNGSLLLDGNSDYCTYPSSIVMQDMFDNNTDSKTIDYWAYFVAGNKIIFEYRQDSSNKYWHNPNSSGHFIWQLTTGGSSKMAIVGAYTLVTGEWIHVALVKVANEYAIYVNGTQDSYGTHNNTFTGSGGVGFIVGNNGDFNAYFNGSIDEMRYQKSNVFGADPDAGLTDTITVPTGPYSAFTATPRSQAIIIN